jgi:hypothetical protein
MRNFEKYKIFDMKMKAKAGSWVTGYGQFF